MELCHKSKFGSQEITGKGDGCKKVITEDMVIFVEKAVLTPEQHGSRVCVRSHSHLVCLCTLGDYRCNCLKSANSQIFISHFTGFRGTCCFLDSCPLKPTIASSTDKLCFGQYSSSGVHNSFQEGMNFEKLIVT